MPKNNNKLMAAVAGLMAALVLSACGVFTDAATRIAYDLKRAVRQLDQDGDRYTLFHQTASTRGQCEGPYKVQFDKAGALIVWCYDEAGQVVASPGTSYHRRFVDTQRTFIVEKAAGETLIVELEQRAGRAVIVDVS